MRWPELHLRSLAFVGAWLVLCPVLMSGEARASTTTMPEGRSEPASARPSVPMPQLLDCMPCFGCYLAPAPVAQGVSGEPPGPREPAGRVTDAELPIWPECIEAGARPPRLPVRIAFCRWLD